MVGWAWVLLLTVGPVPETVLSAPGDLVADLDDSGSGPTAVGDSMVLRVRTDPPVPSSIRVDGIPRDDWGLNWLALDPGTHEIAFSAVPGYATPRPLTVEGRPGETVEVVGRFEPLGYLRVVTDPAVPATIDVDGIPRDDWGLWVALPAGPHTVAFGRVPGYSPPSPLAAEILPGELTTVVARYAFDGASPGPDPDAFGLLRVTTDPAVPAQVLVDGTVRNDWALAWLKLSPGTHTVSFTDVPGFGTPTPQVVDITPGQTTTVRGTFVPFGSIRVTTDPPVPSTIFLDGVPNDNWGLWRFIPPGAYTVSFGAVSGFATPAPRAVTVSASQPTSSTGVFAAAQPYALEWPTAIAFAPDGRVFVAERFAGRIRVIRDGVLLQTPLATFADTATTGEQGLLGLALDPGFPQAPWLYAYQTYVAASGGVSNRIVRVRATDEVGGAPEPVLDRIPASTVHNGGVIGFGPDGKLYALVGDAQDANAAQDLRRLNGKVIRLNADGSVPSDNPFFGQGNANPYVYTYGHRNMFGLAFHPATGTAYITENGPQDSDEVNLLVPGGNYGWPVVRGTANRPPYIDPIATWTPTIAPTNAAFPTGSRFASFEGDLVLGDWNTGTLRRLDLDPPRYDSVAAEDLVMRTPDGILEMEPAPDGSIWFTTPSAVFRWAPSAVLESLGIHVPSAGPPAPGSIASWRTVPASAVSTAPRVTLDASRRES